MSKRDHADIVDVEQEIERRVKALQTAEAICGADGILPSLADDPLMFAATMLSVLPQSVEARLVAVGAVVEAEFYRTLMEVLEEKVGGPPYLMKMLNPDLAWPVVDGLPLDQWIVRTLATHQPT
jgi:hypothetical protein